MKRESESSDGEKKQSFSPIKGVASSIVDNIDPEEKGKKENENNGNRKNENKEEVSKKSDSSSDSDNKSDDKTEKKEKNGNKKENGNAENSKDNDEYIKTSLKDSVISTLVIKNEADPAEDSNIAQDTARAALNALESSSSDEEESEDNKEHAEVFETQTAPIEQNRKPKNYTKTEPVRQQKKVYRKHRGVSIANFDPEDRRPFTDPLTLEAIENLSVREEDLFYPTDRDLIEYTRDKRMYEMVKKNLIKRADKTRRAVKQECDRIARTPPPEETFGYMKRRSASTKNSPSKRGLYNVKSYEELEQDKMEDMRKRNKKEAEQIIISILQEKIMQEEDMERQQKEAEDRKRREMEMKIKRREERKRMLEIAMKQEEAEKKKAKEDEEKYRQQKEREARNAELMRIKEEKRKEEFQKEEKERQEKLEAARKKAEKVEHERQKMYNQQRKNIAERELKFEKKRETERLARKQASEMKEKEKQERLRKLRRQQDKMIREKRIESEKREKQVEHNVNMSIEHRNAVAQHFKEQEDKKLQRIMQFKNITEKEREEKARDDYEKRTMKREEMIMEREMKEDRERKEGALASQFRLEEKKRIATMRAAKNAAVVKEKVRIYDAHMKVLEQEAYEKRMALEKQNKMRQLLQKRSQDVKDGDALMKAELRKKNMAGINKMAKDWDIDVDKIMQDLYAKRNRKMGKGGASSPRSKSGQSSPKSKTSVSTTGTKSAKALPPISQKSTKKASRSNQGLVAPGTA